MRRLIRKLAPALLLLAMPALALAEPAPPSDALDGPGRPPRAEQMEAFRMYKLTEALDLSTEEAARVFPLIKDMEKELRRLHDQERDVIRSLDQELQRSHPDEEKLKQGLAAVKETRRQMMQLHEEHAQRLSKELSTEKMARFVVFQVKWQERMREAMEGIRERRQERRARGADRREDMPDDPPPPPLEPLQ